MNSEKEVFTMKNGIKIGMIWAIAFLILMPIGGTPVGNVMAVDVGSDSDNSTNITCIVQTGIPKINYYDLRDATSSVMNAMIDVNQTYYFVINVTQESGWADLDYINITAWYDGGTESGTYGYGSGAPNTQFFIRYENTTGTATVTIQYPTTGEIDSVSFTETVIDSTTHNITIAFRPRDQIRYAPGDGSWDTTEGWNDANTWNFRMNVSNSGGGYNNSARNEFGVYRFTNITASGDPQGSGVPGQLVYLTSTNTVVKFKTNYNFRMNVSLDTDLLNTALGTSIAATNVEVNATNLNPATMTPTLTTWTAFTGTGINNPVWIFGDATPSYHNAFDSGIQESLETQWRVQIPIGTPAGTYTAAVTYIIEQA